MLSKKYLETVAKQKRALLHLETTNAEGLDCEVVGKYSTLINMTAYLILSLAEEMDGNLHDNTGDILSDIVAVINGFFEANGGGKIKKGN